MPDNAIHGDRTWDSPSAMNLPPDADESNRNTIAEATESKNLEIMRKFSEQYAKK